MSTRLIGELGAHGLKISEITELLLIILCSVRAPTTACSSSSGCAKSCAAVSTEDAVEHSLARVGESISASAATVIFALLTLLLASFGIYRDLGIPLAIGIAVILLSGLTLLPAMLAIFGRAAFWPSTARARDGAAPGYGAVSQAVSSNARR